MQSCKMLWAVQDMDGHSISGQSPLAVHQSSWVAASSQPMHASQAYLIYGPCQHKLCMPMWRAAWPGRRSCRPISLS